MNLNKSAVTLYDNSTLDWKKRKKNSVKSYAVHLALQFSDNVRTFFSKCNTKRPVDLFTNTVTKWNNLVLEAVTWCLEGTQQVSLFLKNASFLLYSKRILKAIFVSIWVLPVSWKTRVMVPSNRVSFDSSRKDGSDSASRVELW